MCCKFLRLDLYAIFLKRPFSDEILTSNRMDFVGHRRMEIAS